MTSEDLNKLLDYLLSFPEETEWIEYKLNNFNPELIGEYISAISNAACLHDQTHGYLIFGIQDKTKKVAGTTFNPKTLKVKNQELANWLDCLLGNEVQYTFHSFNRNGSNVVITEIRPAIGYPARFKGEAFIRVGTYKKKLSDHSRKEKALWDKLNMRDFESQLAIENISSEKVLNLLDYPSIFDLLGIPFPPDRQSILEKLEEEKFITSKGELFSITNLGALLFAKKLDDFEYLERKSVRVVVYKGIDRSEAVTEQAGIKGYASGFGGLVRFVIDHTPTNELIGLAIRKDTKMYPKLAIRELLANTLIHQDLNIKGTGPMIEIFTDRIEFSNPGKPLINILRFLDHAPRSRNEKMAKIMRRIGICEERGSGIDKVVFQVELFQLPPPDFQTNGDFTRVVLYAHRILSGMDRADKIRAAYQHACLNYVSSSYMTNESLRKRFNIGKTNYPMASRIIADTIDAKLIKLYNAESKSKKYAKYIPYWA